MSRVRLVDAEAACPHRGSEDNKAYPTIADEQGASAVVENQLALAIALVVETVTARASWVQTEGSGSVVEDELSLGFTTETIGQGAAARW